MARNKDRDVNYFVTTFNTNRLETEDKSHRCVGYFRDLHTAEEVVLKNIGDIFEFYYMYALIEAIPEGLYQHAWPDRKGQPSKDRWWFRAYEGVDGKWHYGRTSEPDWAKNIVGYAIG